MNRDLLPRTIKVSRPTYGLCWARCISALLVSCCAMAVALFMLQISFTSQISEMQLKLQLMAEEQYDENQSESLKMHILKKRSPDADQNYDRWAHITKTTTSAPDTTTAVADDLDTFARLDQSVHLTLVDPTAPDDTGVHFFWKDIRDSQRVPVAKFNHTTGNLTISMTGFYYVYGQVTYANTSRNNGFTMMYQRHHNRAIQVFTCKTGVEPMIRRAYRKALHRNVDYHHHGHERSCYSAIPMYLHKGDKLQMKQLYRYELVKRTTDETFWGVVCLDCKTDDKLHAVKKLVNHYTADE